jgi:hypothetical protein
LSESRAARTAWAACAERGGHQGERERGMVVMVVVVVVVFKSKWRWVIKMERLQAT